MDKSALLQQVVDREYGGNPQMLLGELQVRPVLRVGCATDMAGALSDLGSLCSSERAAHVSTSCAAGTSAEANPECTSWMAL